MESSDIDWEKLENEVEETIGKKDASLISFDSKAKEECKYQQKVAESELSRLGVLINVIILVFAVGISFSLTFVSLKDPAEYIGYVFGVVLLTFGLLLVYRWWKPKYETCEKIILNAEKRLLSDDSAETKPPQEAEPVAETKETKKRFFEGTIEITILFFTVYAFTRDYFIEDKSKAIGALLAAIFMVFVLVVVLRKITQRYLE